MYKIIIVKACILRNICDKDCIKYYKNTFSTEKYIEEDIPFINQNYIKIIFKKNGGEIQRKRFKIVNVIKIYS